MYLMNTRRLHLHYTRMLNKTFMIYEFVDCNYKFNMLDIMIVDRVDRKLLTTF